MLSPFKQKLSDAGITDIKYSTTGDLLASSTADGIVFIFKEDGEDFNVIGRFEGLGFINQIAWLKSDLKLLAGCKDGTIHLLDLQTSHDEIVYQPNDDDAMQITCIATSQRVFLIAGCINGTILILMKKGLQPYTFRAHSMPISSINLPPGDEFIITTSYDGIIRCWNLNPPPYAPVKHTCIFSSSVTKGPILYSQIITDGSHTMFAVATGSSTVYFFKFEGTTLKLTSPNKIEFATGGYPSQFTFMNVPNCEKYKVILYQNNRGEARVYDTTAKHYLYTIRLFGDNFGHAITAHPIKLQFAVGGGPRNGLLYVISLTTMALQKAAPSTTTQSMARPTAPKPLSTPTIQNAQQIPMPQSFKQSNEFPNPNLPISSYTEEQRQMLIQMQQRALQEDALRRQQMQAVKKPKKQQN